MLIFIFFLVGVTVQQQSINPQQLGCNEKMYGNFANTATLFKQMMQPGDTFVINGTVNQNYRVTATNLANRDSPGDIACHFRCDAGQQYSTVNAFINGAWGDIAYPAPNPMVGGMPFETAITFTGTGFNIYVNNNFIWNLPLRNNRPNTIGTNQNLGDIWSNWIELRCANSPVADQVPTRPPFGSGNGNGGWGGNGNGNGGRGGNNNGGWSGNNKGGWGGKGNHGKGGKGYGKAERDQHVHHHHHVHHVNGDKSSSSSSSDSDTSESGERFI